MCQINLSTVDEYLQSTCIYIIGFQHYTTEMQPYRSLPTSVTSLNLCPHLEREDDDTKILKKLTEDNICNILEKHIWITVALSAEIHVRME